MGMPHVRDLSRHCSSEVGKFSTGQANTSIKDIVNATKAEIIMLEQIKTENTTLFMMRRIIFVKMLKQGLHAAC